MNVKRATKAFAVSVSACLVLLVAGRAGAQTLTSGAVEGVIRDSAGGAMVGVNVTLMGVSTGATRTTVTAQDGSYRFMLVGPGDYQLVLERIGYRPVHVEGVAVNEGQRLDVGATLARERTPTGVVDVQRLPGAGHERPGLSEWIPSSAFSRVPGDRPDLTQVARVSSMLGPDLASEGLPPSYTGLALDGLRYEVARNPAYPGVGLGASLPLTAVSFADYIGAPVDAEWSGSAGGILAAHTPTGSRSPAVRAFGRWSVPSLVSSPNFDTHGLSLNDGDGGVLFTGPVMRDSAFLAIGVEARHTERALAGLWPQGMGNDLLQVAKDNFGTDLASYTRPRVARSEAVSAFTRFDWQVSSDNSVDARAVFTRIPHADDGSTPTVSAGLGPTYLGNDFVASAGLRSVLGGSTANELRIGFDGSTRDFGTADAATPLPLTLLASPELGFGEGAASQGHFGQNTFRVRETLLHDVGGQHLRFGLEGSSTSYDQAYQFGAAGTFLFGSVADFAARRGVFVQPSGGPNAQFSIGRYAAFAEDGWNPAPGIELLFGARFQREQLPKGLITRDAGWLALTGISNDALPRTRVRTSPRASLTWDVENQHEWVLRAAASSDDDPWDPAILGELATQNGTIHVRRGVGTLSGWPALPSTSEAPSQGAVLSVLDPSFRPPRTEHVSGGLTRALGRGAAFDISATYRRTDFLPGRTDLNLITGPLGSDQNGRPLFGTLTQVGALLTAVPGSNRRFAGYDAVWALQSNASSNYWGATAGIHGVDVGPLELMASYTHSSASDNWPSAWALPSGAWAPGLSVGAQGPADYDVPDRVVLGAELHGPLGLRLAGLYRYRSGLPFTPTFPAGVDANADGSVGNDPAFVDAGVTGMSDLLSRFPCLSSQQGQFVTRNSCRAPGVHSLDARASLGLFRLGGSQLQATFDGVNLLQSSTGFVDAALLQLNPAGSITGGRVPYVANPHFGASLAPQLSGRVFRVGLTLNW
jgi:hypothetical protein